MNIKKLLATGSLAVLLSANLSGCMTHTTLQDAKKAKNQTIIQEYGSDSLIGFVVNKDGKLIMLGKNSVYVFDDNQDTKKLKQVLATPEFLTLKKMAWTTVAEGQSNSISYNPKNQTFIFNAKFDFSYKDEKEYLLLKSLGFHNEEIGTRLNDNRNLTHQITLNGKVYQHNSSTQNLIKSSKPLSKSYDFKLIGSSKSNAKSFGTLLLLPFAVVGDILTFPLSYMMYGMLTNPNGAH